jgi:DNA-binding CsgD family transcriptional regulator
MVRNPTLQELISMPAFTGDSTLHHLMEQLIGVENTITFVCQISERNFIYMDSKMKEIFGIPVEEFLIKGSDRIYEMTAAESLPEIINTQMWCINFAKSPSFDPNTFPLVEFKGKMIAKDGTIRDIVIETIILTFSSHGDLGLAICVIVEATERAKIEWISKLLDEIKLRHNQVYTHEPIVVETKPLKLVHITSKRLDAAISQREEEVLVWLARGLSTNEIANELGMTINTVETHRKNLLSKMEARNTTELIKKASKVYWLE